MFGFRPKERRLHVASAAFPPGAEPADAALHAGPPPTKAWALICPNPRCDTELVIMPDQSGQWVVCPTCSFRFVAPRLVPIRLVSRRPASRPGAAGAKGGGPTLYGEPVPDDAAPEGSVLRRALASMSHGPAGGARQLSPSPHHATPAAALDALARLSAGGSLPPGAAPAAPGAESQGAAPARAQSPGSAFASARSPGAAGPDGQDAGKSEAMAGLADLVPRGATSPDALDALVQAVPRGPKSFAALEALARSLRSGGRSADRLEPLKRIPPQAAPVAAHRVGARPDAASPAIVRESIARAGAALDRRRHPRANSLPVDPSEPRPREYSLRMDLVLVWVVAIVISGALVGLAWLADLPELVLASILFIGLAVLRTLMGSRRKEGDLAER